MPPLEKYALPIQSPGSTFHETTRVLGELLRDEPRTLDLRRRRVTQLRRLALNLIRIYAILSQPFIPDASATMMQALNTSDWTWPSNVSDAIRTLPAGHGFAVPENLFRKITDEERAEWQTKFAGIRT